VRVKIILSVVLSLFIASSIVALVVRTIRDASESHPAAAEPAKASPGESGARVVVYFFHGKVRCPTCETIESYGHEAVSEGFPEDLRAGRLAWRVLDYEDPENLALAKKFEVIAPTIVVARLDGGSPAHWDNLSDVWGLTGDKAKFLEYVRENVRDYLAAIPRNRSTP
jgi:hypothetical protein